MSSQDPRPRVWVGHVVLPTSDIHATRGFMLKLGMRAIADGDEFAVLELRGGTHLVLLPSEESASGAAPFDLMVDDLVSTHREFHAIGLKPSPIQKGKIHDSFTVAAPSGHTVTFNSTHVSDQPV